MIKLTILTIIATIFVIVSTVQLFTIALGILNFNPLIGIIITLTTIGLDFIYLFLIYQTWKTTTSERGSQE